MSLNIISTTATSVYQPVLLTIFATTSTCKQKADVRLAIFEARFSLFENNHLLLMFISVHS